MKLKATLMSAGTVVPAYSLPVSRSVPLALVIGFLSTREHCPVFRGEGAAHHRRTTPDRRRCPSRPRPATHSRRRCWTRRAQRANTAASGTASSFSNGSRLSGYRCARSQNGLRHKNPRPAGLMRSKAMALNTLKRHAHDGRGDSPAANRIHVLLAHAAARTQFARGCQCPGHARVTARSTLSRLAVYWPDLGSQGWRMENLLGFIVPPAPGWHRPGASAPAGR